MRCGVIWIQGGAAHTQYTLQQLQRSIFIYYFLLLFRYWLLACSGLCLSYVGERVSEIVQRLDESQHPQSAFMWSNLPCFLIGK